MNLSGLGALTSGMDQGVTTAARLQAIRQQQQQYQQQQRARAAVGQMLMALPGGGGVDSGMPPQAMPQPPMPGQASLPAPRPDMGIPGASYDPVGNLGDMTGPPDPTEMGQFQIDGAPPLPQPLQPGMPPEPTGAGGEPLAGPAAETGDVQRDSQGTILNIARQLKAANPDITPEQMFDAVNLHIEQMKGVRNDVKDYMTAQVEVLKAQTRLQQTEMRVAGQQGVAETNAGARVDSAGIRSDAQRYGADQARAGRENSAGIAAESRERVAQIMADNRLDVTAMATNSREVIAATGADAKRYASDQAYRAKVNAASITAGVIPQAGPATRQPNTTPRPQWNGPRAAPGKYKSPDEVKADFTAGKISQERATQILRTQFGLK